MSDIGIGREQLRAFIERIERLEEEKAAIADDIKEVYAEAKATGFDTKVMRRVVKLRKENAQERAEFEAILDLYMHALGMIDDAAVADPETGEVDGEDLREPTRAARHGSPVGFDLGPGV